MVQDTPDARGMRVDQIGDAHVLDQDFGDRIRRSLKTWCLRWVLGFALIWAITAIIDGLGWLWTLGIILAAVSLMATLAGHFIIRRKAEHLRSRHNRALGASATGDTQGKTR